MEINDAPKAKLAALIGEIGSVKLATLHAEAAPLLGHVLLDLLEEHGLGPDEIAAVGGSDVGLVASVLHAAAARGQHLGIFEVSGTDTYGLPDGDVVIIEHDLQAALAVASQVKAVAVAAVIGDPDATQEPLQLAAYRPNDVLISDPDGFLTWGNGEKLGGVNGVGPWLETHPGTPIPADPHFDAELLEHGDRRNVVDRYRYWSVAAIHADLEGQRSKLQIAIENLEHDLNIGSIVRTANAFNAAGVHIVGRRKWNRRGALVTDRYLNIYHHRDAQSLADWARENGYELIAVDNTGTTEPIAQADLPAAALLVFGQESTGISQPLRDVCQRAVYIPQFGSTRSLNVAAAAAIAQHEWVRRHRG